MIMKRLLLLMMITVIAFYLFQTRKSHTSEISISGAWALYPLMLCWTDSYHAKNPDLVFNVTSGGAGKGMTDMLSDMVDIAMVSRAVRKEETGKGAVELAVAADAVVLTCSSSNPLLQLLKKRGLNKSNLQKLFVQRQKLTCFELFTEENRTDPILPYTRSDSCGAAETIASFLGVKQEDLAGTGVFGDPGMVTALKNDAAGIGYNNISFAYDQKTGKMTEGLFVIPLDLDGNSVIDTDEDFYSDREQILKAVASGKYPSPPARDLYVVIKKERMKPETRAFLEYILSDGQKFIDTAGYVRISDEKLQKSRSSLE